MTPAISRLALFCIAGLLASPAAQAAVYKCRQGERVIYQELPCPATTQAMPTPEALPEPSAFEVERARQRAKTDIAAADALRQRDAKLAKAQARTQAAAGRHEAGCDRLLEKIEKAEEKSAKNATLNGNKRKYRKECGPL